MNKRIENPYFDVLKSITGDNNPPEFCKGIFNTSELSDDNYENLQEWCLNNSNLEWSTGIGFLEAADHIVEEAVSNGNIYGK